jgi:NAD(P)-dependent dehydrogenase (short-subunit alcohol dehydrogenase family)
MASQFATYPSLKDKIVVVTGGASGIGEAIVRAFVEQQARVFFLDLQDKAAQQLQQSLAGQGLPLPTYLPCDLTDIKTLREAVSGIVASCGTVDVLVNNAGNDARHVFEEVTPEFWDAAMAVNLKQQFFMAQAVTPVMRAAKSGSIINMSSISWMIPSTGLPVYVTAKAAIVGMTRTLAHELGTDNIRVNCVLPGAILTERQQRLWMTPEYSAEVMASQAIKRHILPDEVARLVLFLAADDSTAITNQSYVIDGGWV